MRVLRERKGQFIIIAALLLSIMIISVSTVIYGTVTYFRHERWEEYVTIIDSVKTGSSNVLEISLANYAQTLNSTILRDNLNQWIRDVRKAYPGFGVDLSYTLATGVRSAYGVSLNYSLGLARTWNQQVSFSGANATFNINIASAGLTGYNFTTHAFLKMNIRDTIWYSKDSKQYVVIYLSVDKDGPEPIINLQKSNFVEVKLSGSSKTFTMKRYYSSAYSYFIYEIQTSVGSAPPPGPTSVEVTMQDTRGIKTVSYSTSIQENNK